MAHGKIKRTKEGTYAIDLHSKGVRVRKRAKTKRDAIAIAQQKSIEIENLQRPLTQTESADLIQARRELPEGISLLECVRYFCKHNRLTTTSLTCSEALDRYLDQKRGAGLRERSIRDIETRMEHWRRHFGSVHLNSVGAEHLIEYVSQFEGTNRNNYRKHLRMFYNWCVRAGYVVYNPADAIERVKVKATPPTVWTPEQVERWLRTVEDVCPEYAAYWAVLVFAGVRPNEAQRIEAVDISGNIITLDESKTKTAQTRHITMTDNLCRWLERYPVRGDLCVDGYNAWRIAFVATKKAAKVDEWPEDVMRHTFASAYIILHGAEATRAALGHRSEDMLFRHYRSLYTHKDAEALFQILPR